MCFFPKKKPEEPIKVDVSSAKRKANDDYKRRYLNFLNKVETCLKSNQFKKDFLSNPNGYIYLRFNRNRGMVSYVSTFNTRNSSRIRYDDYGKYLYGIKVSDDLDLDNPRFK